MIEDVSLLASRAAIELDNVSLRRGAVLDAVKELKGKLDAIFDVPLGVAMFMGVVKEHPELAEGPLTHVEELRAVIRGLAERLDAITLDDHDKAGALRSICLSVSQAAAHTFDFASQRHMVA